jgi:hypothetical protein
MHTIMTSAQDDVLDEAFALIHVLQEENATLLEDCARLARESAKPDLPEGYKLQYEYEVSYPCAVCHREKNIDKAHCIECKDKFIVCHDCDHFWYCDMCESFIWLCNDCREHTVLRTNECNYCHSEVHICEECSSVRSCAMCNNLMNMCMDCFDITEGICDNCMKNLNL